MSALTANHATKAMEEIYGTVEVEARFAPATEPRAAGALVVSVTIPPGCHVQAHDPGDPFLIPFELRFNEGAPVGAFDYPEAELVTLSWSPKILRVYHDRITIAVPLTEPTASLRGSVSFQACTETMCLWPAELPFEVAPAG